MILGSIKDAVTNRNYRRALELEAEVLSEILDSEPEDKIAAGIARELRIILEKLGVNDETEHDSIKDARKRVSDKL